MLMPRKSHTIDAPIASDAVAGMRRRTASVTGSFVWYE